MLSKKTLFVWLLILAVAQIAFAQAPATATTPDTAVAAPATPAIDGGTPTFLRPETPEQRAARVGPVDPGPNPDPKQTFYRYGKRYHIEKYDNVRSRVVMTGGDPGWGRPVGWANIYREVYQKNDKYTWFWFEEHDAAQTEEIRQQAVESTSKWPEESLKYFRSTRAEFSPLTPPAADKTISFSDSSDGLPKSGSWRNSLAVADMKVTATPTSSLPPSARERTSRSSFSATAKDTGRCGT